MLIHLAQVNNQELFFILSIRPITVTYTALDTSIKSWTSQTTETIHMSQNQIEYQTDNDFF